MITLDDDLQHPPEEIPKLLAELKACDGLDAVYGVPIKRRGASWRRALSWMFNLVSSPALSKPLRLRDSGFRALRRSLVGRIPPIAHRDLIISTLLFQVTPRIAVVRVAHCDSALAASRYPLRTLIRLSFDTLGSLSDGRRLRLTLIATSFGASLLALAALAIAIEPFGGLASILLASIALLCGLFFLGLGLATAAAQLSALELRRRPIPCLAWLASSAADGIL